ncbi:Retinal rod rhodopsin-sensitive cGMP 3',5'-cyclic phosphodiesterase subunit gamma [Channa argus]|uniref:Rhodopsin-sensitive cGMP 3',5'-cyclic phosphodiesterase subunit gamma n=1 Tax=Channa argus TaxID=215402 RepID=A0A6G1QC48_CHAAH|nr:Retinal rod rhodopsin-sensitive cGMP 3',5'-cyclic phosphodiesterase subunit gamma [Channa argus]
MISSNNISMNLDVPKPEAKNGSKAPPRVSGPGSPHKGPPKFKQRNTRQFKSKPPKRGVIGFGEDIPGMEGLGTDITVICPWEAYSHLELHELAQYGII